MRFEVEFYEKDDGEQPAKEFLLSFDKKMRTKMTDTAGKRPENERKVR